MAIIRGSAGADHAGKGWTTAKVTGGAPGEGDDVLLLDKGNDTAFAAGGDDSVEGGSGADSLTGEGGADTLSGGAGEDKLYGDHGAGVSGADRLDGGVDADWLDGGAGWDTLLGNAGDDFYFTDGVDDLILEVAGGGYDEVFVKADPRTPTRLVFHLPAEVEHLTLLGGFAGIGSNVTNRMTGNAGDNRLEGLGGWDTLVGLGGADTLHGGDGWDTLDGGTGNDVLVAGEGADSLAGGPGDDIYWISADVTMHEEDGNGYDVTVVTGSRPVWLSRSIEGLILDPTGFGGHGNNYDNWMAGNEVDNLLTGAGGLDTILGGPGSDTLDGGRHADVLVGGTGHDLYYIEAADTVWEEAGGGFDAAIARGLDFVWVPAQVEKLFLGPGNAGAAGNAGYEEIWGGEGANWIEGGGGDDTLLGNGGIDVLVGGEGRDHFVIRPGDNVTLPDFTPGLDVMWFTGTTLRSPEAVRGAQYAAGAGSVVFAAGIEVWLPGLGAGSLTWRDLAFG